MVKMPRHRNKSYCTGMVITVTRYTVAQRKACLMSSGLLGGIDSLSCISYFLGGQEGKCTASKEKGMGNILVYWEGKQDVVPRTGKIRKVGRWDGVKGLEGLDQAGSLALD